MVKEDTRIDPARDLAVAQLEELREVRRLRLEKRIIGGIVCALIIAAAKAGGFI